MAESPAGADVKETGVGSYFVANYPPFSVWTEAALADANKALASPPQPDVPLGLYLHIPFCRKRCHFCYFRVYTNKNSRQVEEYLDLLASEWDMYLNAAAVAGRRVDFVYFGGGTPSFLSTAQLESLVGRLTGGVGSWPGAAEVTFECEPGTLSESKLAALRGFGVTRLSLGVENFDDQILDLNGRAHRSPEIFRVYQQARAVGFPQINIDLIAGMLGETDENWKNCIERTLALSPDSVTIYQMELPYNTTISGNLLKGSTEMGAVAGWDTKRRWVAEAFEALERAGYHIGSAYTAVKNPERTTFLYRDRLWEGADLVGIGVASFGHINGVHVQNVDTWERYAAALSAGELPLGRAYRPSVDERLIREFILQMKRGAVRPAYFEEKYGADPLVRFEPQLESLQSAGYLAELSPDRIALTREGLMRVDSLLHQFFLPEHTGIRYT